MRYSIEPKQENILKGMAFCHLQENLEINEVKKLMDPATKTGKDTAKTASKKLLKKLQKLQKI